MKYQFKCKPNPTGRGWIAQTLSPKGRVVKTLYVANEELAQTALRMMERDFNAMSRIDIKDELSWTEKYRLKQEEYKHNETI